MATQRERLFTRLATGRRKGERAYVTADKGDTIAPLKCRDVSQVFYFMREAERRIRAATNAAARREADNGNAYEWNPQRPARR